MKKFYVLLVTLLGVTFAQAQFTINFDSFTTGDVSTQSPYLILWPAATATEPQVSTAQSHSAPNSMWVRPAATGVADDILFQLGNKTSGTWIAKFWMYVPGGNNGYFNIQEDENATPAQWNGEFFVDLTATGGAPGLVTHDQTSSTAAYPNDAWFQIVITVDLDLLEISVTVDGNSLLQNAAYSGVITGASVPADQLGGIDFFSADSGTSFYIDDFELHEICYPPTNLVVNTFTDSTADISWTAASNETGGYSWKLMANGDDPITGTPLQSGTTPTAITSVSLTGLAAYTEHDFYVLSSCAASMGNSVLIGPLEFKTNAQCGLSGAVSSFPFTVGFELSSTTLGCWTQVKEDGDAAWVFATGSSSGSVTTAYNGTQNARFVSTVGTNSPVTKLVSPVFDLTGLANPELSFYYAQEDYVGDQNELKVYYRQSSADAWAELAHYTSNVAAWTEERMALPNPTATYQIAFEGINNYGHANVIDEVRVGEVLSVESYVFENLKFYPNPVGNKLFLNSKQPIDKIIIYSVLGEKLVSKRVGGTHVVLNTSAISSGICLMEVFIGNDKHVYKLLKR